MKTIKDLFQKFEDKVAGLEETPEVTNEEFAEIINDLQYEETAALPSDLGGIINERAFKYRIFKYFSLVKGFIKAQHLENQRDLWLTTVDLLNDSKAFNNEKKEEVRVKLLMGCFRELENLNNTILQLANKPDTTVEGNSEKANKPDTTVKGNAEKANKPDDKFNWQGTQAQLVFLIEQLYEQGFLSSIIQPEKFSLLSQHFTVKGKSLNPKTLAQIRQNSLNRKGGKPKGVEKIEQIISAAKKQND